MALMSPSFQFIEMATERASYIDIQNQHSLCNRNGAEFAASPHAAYLSGATSEDILSSYNSSSELISSQKVLRARCLDPSRQSEEELGFLRLQLSSEVTQIFLKSLVTTDE